PRTPWTDSDDQVNEGDGAVGETASARTERELAALRGESDTGVDCLLARIRSDVDPRNLARGQPLAVFGTLGSLAAIVGIAFASRVKSFRRSRTEKELDQIVERLGGRLDRLKGRARKRFRETLKKEIGEVETGPRAKQVVWESAAGALTAAARLFARRFVSRLTGDEEFPDREAYNDERGVGQGDRRRAGQAGGNRERGRHRGIARPGADRRGESIPAEQDRPDRRGYCADEERQRRHPDCARIDERHRGDRRGSEDDRQRDVARAVHDREDRVTKERD